MVGLLVRACVQHTFCKGKRGADSGAAAVDAPAVKKAKQPILCFNCGEEGHKMADCPKPKKEQA